MIDHDLHDHDEDFEYVGADDDDNQHMDHVYKTIIPITMTIWVSFPRTGKMSV